jgi:Amt family ammonium transporter
MLGKLMDKNWFSRFRYFCLFLGTIVVLIVCQTALADVSGTEVPNAEKNFSLIQNIWLLLAGALVFFMNAGFALLEAGFCRRNNSINVLAKNLVVFCVAAIAFWMFGFGLMFGDSSYHFPCRGDFEQKNQGIKSYLGHFSPTREYNQFEPKSQFILLPKNYNSLGYPSQGFSCLQRKFPKRSIASVFFFQLAFAGTAATIVSGAVAERIKFWAFFWFSFILVGFLYPIVGHWVWSEYGWLKQEFNFIDFAGSTVIHTVGGTAALAGAILLKPRWSSLNGFGYDPWEDLERDEGSEALSRQRQLQEESNDQRNLTSATLGCLILWLGWLGFNGGSTNEVQEAGHIILTTTMSAATGGIVAILPLKAFLYEIFRNNSEGGKPDLSSLINGILGGLVGITASAAYVDVITAIFIGAVSGAVVILGSELLKYLRIDDPVGAVPVHLFCGCWGTFAVSFSLRGTEVYEKTYNFLERLGWQMSGWLIVFIITFLVSYVIWILIGLTLYWLETKILRKERTLSQEGNLLKVPRQGIRVTPQEELQGSDGYWENPG